MTPLRATAPLALVTTIALTAASAASVAPSTASAAASAPSTTHQPSRSRELWATVDVCNAKDQPDTLGIRGSMPGNDQSGETMYMRFRVQYLDASTSKWLDLGQGADSGFLKVGSAALTRQAGRSFQLAPSSGKTAYTLRGEVIFQWRKGTTVLEAVTKATSAGHTSLAGADPRGFSAATCTLP
jgi:hypothetical protein